MADPSTNPISRITFLGLGLLCLLLACLGFFLPGLPGTPFLLLAAACFARSSPRLHNWLLANKFFGPVIKNWQESRSIPRRSKRIALLMIFVAGGFSLYSISNLYFKLALIVILTVPVTILLRLKETESLLPVENGAERE
ncbi:MAG: YbaN family protein [Thermodesulfobacteriota bacterium]